MTIAGAVRTEREKVRWQNKDAVVSFPELHLYVVVDGIEGREL